MKLTTRSRYGLRMLLDIALNADNGPVCIQDISKRRDISVKYLEKLIRPLKEAGFVRSKRGPSGGHLLAKAPEDITVAQIVRVLENKPTVSECVDNPESCPIATSCVARKVWQKATQDIYDSFDKIRLSDLIEDARKSDTDGLPCC